MHVRYLDRRFGPPDTKERIELFKRLFAHLLLQTDGDAERALEQLERIGDRYNLFDEHLSFEELKDYLVKKQIISSAPGQPVSLTPKGERFIRTQSLDEIFKGLKFDPSGGQHRTSYSGVGGERQTETRPYQFGDDVNHIDFLKSLQNGIRRSLDVNTTLLEEDLEVYETERHVSVATCLLLDVSHSMILYGEDRITPAKRVAMALAELIKQKYPKDALHIILFGDVAQEVTLRDLTYCGVGPYHTNTHMALQMARNILVRKKQANKQIFMITDGKPTALFEGGDLYINSMGADPRIINKTLNEAAECKRHGIPITTFMIAQDPWLVRFVEDLTEINKGRAFYASLDKLEQTVFVDFMQNRRKKMR